MFSNPSSKYRPFPPIHLPNRQWPSRTITAAPIWTSVDLRDGNQALAQPMNVAQKLEMFHALVKCGFKEIEVGFPAASNTEFAFNRHLIEENRIPADVAVQVLVQAREDLIERTVESLIGAKSCIIHLYNSTSPAQRRVVFGMSKDDIIRMAVRGATWIKERAHRIEDAGGRVQLQYSPESFSATELDFAKDISEAVMDVWQPTAERRMILNLPDTVEVAGPNVYADQIEWMCSNIRNREALIISLHTHNDRGTGVAATELGLLAGADRVEGTLFGNGERTGNLDIVTVAMNLHMHGIPSGLDFSRINDLIQMYERCTGMTVPPRQPYAGELVFTAFSGSHQDAIKKGLAEREKVDASAKWDVPYLTIDPSDLGREYREVIRVNSQSGKGGVAFMIEQHLGITLPKDLHREFGPIANDFVDTLGREVQAEELAKVFHEEYEAAKLPWTIGKYSFQTEGQLTRFDGEVFVFDEAVSVSGAGVGNIGAFGMALNHLMDAGMPSCNVADFHEDTMGTDTSAAAVSFVQVEFAGRKRAWGIAVDKNSGRAPLSALLSAFNRGFPWVMLERSLGIVLPDAMRAEFSRLARGHMEETHKRLSYDELDRLFLDEYILKGKASSAALSILREVFTYDLGNQRHECQVDIRFPDGAIKTGKGSNADKQIAYSSALANALTGQAEVVHLDNKQRAHPSHGRQESDYVAFVKLRFGNGELVWGAGFNEKPENSVVGAIASAASRFYESQNTTPEHSKNMNDQPAIRKPYPFDHLEPKWQRIWNTDKTYRTPNPGDADFDASRPKYYVLDMFPYPSGAGLHVGHPEGYTATDIIARYKTMNGFNVLHPMGWDAFGLPAENYAIKSGQHPRATTEQNVERFRAQLQSIGFAYDWDREVNTTDEGYYKWTQWIFLQIYHSWVNPATNRAEPISTYTGEDPDSVRLAYIAHAPVNWCQALGTVIANEEVIDGKSEVGGHPVERRPMRQWMLRITAYAQRLIDELDGLDWPESIKIHQRNWIGRSDGAEVHFAIVGSEEKLTVFTTRPDTLFGATYMVLAPEHPLVDALTTPENRDAVATYRRVVASKSDLDRTDLAKDKSGVNTGAFAINPVNGQSIPIWIADYVLMGYGTGAIMAVPAHDTRDFEFAEKFALPILQVVQPKKEGVAWQGFIEDGFAVNSVFLDGLETPEAKKHITAWLAQRNAGTARINYKLRDWLFSRQRYWGEPFPILWEGGKHRTISESELPLLLPALADFKPTGTPEGPLSKAGDWLKVGDATREINTMPQWAGSCWYYLRYTDARCDTRFASKEAEAYWSMGNVGLEIAKKQSDLGGQSFWDAVNTTESMTSENGKGAKPGGVDLYVGGTEHAVLHLLYARFWHKVLFDLGHVSTPEPFQRLVNQGLILGETEYTAFEHADNSPCSSSELKDIEEEATASGPRLVGIHKTTGEKINGHRAATDEVEKRGDGFYLKSHPHIRVDARAFKMSKSRGNVVNPDEVIRTYGADSLRCYEMFMGPLEASKPWSMSGVEGVSRFLARVWRLVMEEKADAPGQWHPSTAVADVPMDTAIAKAVHATIKKVGEDIETLSFNTAISAMMICTNALTAATPRPRAALAILLQVLNPFAPHITEELWETLGLRAQRGLISSQPWPQYDPSILIENEVEIPVQVNGKVRDKIIIAREATRADIEAAARACPKVAEQLQGKLITKVIIVPGRLANFVVG